MRRPVALIVLLATTVSLSGCVSWFLPPSATSTSAPTGEEVAAELEPFYSQVLQWSSCGGGMQCSIAVAPLDWSDPAGDRIELALVRQPATSGTALGSLLVNPGGPGGSGYDFVHDSIDYATDERLQASFDVVGFDPRGVGRSTAVTCHDEPAELDAYLYGLYPGARGSAEWLDAAATAARGFGARCLELTGPLLGHVDTESAARDLDLLRAVLGDTKLNYLGYSYGTLLGQVYAQLFPQRTGRLVFDGAVDPALSTFDATAAQAVGFEGVLRTFLAECLGSSDCPFDGTVDDALTRIRSLLDELDRRPLPSTSDGRVLGSDAMFSAIVLPLYDPANWGYLRELFATVLAGSSDYAFQLADSYHGRNADGSYRLNQTEAFISINCLDSREPADPAQLRTEADELARRAPVFGPQMAWGAVGCSQWPVPSKGARGAIAAAGSADILVVGTTHDPATPYAWAVRVASQLENGHLVSYDGDGHTAYNKSNECVDNAVDAFLLEGAVPAADPQC